MRDLSSSSVYLSGKVPYVFDYADHDTDVNHHGGSDHGTHVAGIVAANPADGSVTGVAPQAQLMILKVFPDGSTGANSDDILAGAGRLRHARRRRRDPLRSAPPPALLTAATC